MKDSPAVSVLVLVYKVEKVYRARSGGMYRSAFAKTAALVNGRPFEMFEF